MTQPGIDLGQRTRGQFAVLLAAVPAFEDQARVFEHADVSRDGWKRHFVWCGQISHRCFAIQQPQNHLPSSRVGECTKGAIECSILNYFVSYMTRTGSGQAATRLRSFPPGGFQRLREIRRKISLDSQCPPGYWMLEIQFPGMEELALEAVPVGSAVGAIA